jgi:hypothetical protein
MRGAAEAVSVNLFKPVHVSALTSKRFKPAGSKKAAVSKMFLSVEPAYTSAICCLVLFKATRPNLLGPKDAYHRSMEKHVVHLLGRELDLLGERVTASLPRSQPQ